MKELMHLAGAGLVGYSIFIVFAAHDQVRRIEAEAATDNEFLSLGYERDCESRTRIREESDSSLRTSKVTAFIDW